MGQNHANTLGRATPWPDESFKRGDTVTYQGRTAVVTRVVKRGSKYHIDFPSGGWMSVAHSDIRPTN